MLAVRLLEMDARKTCARRLGVVVSEAKWRSQAQGEAWAESESPAAMGA
jgi:hypothetical protein